MEREPSTRHILEGRELIDYLVEKSASTTSSALLDREERRNRRLTVLLSVLMAFGIGGVIGALKMFVREEMTSVQSQMAEISASIEAYVDEKAHLLRDDLEAQVGAVVTEQVNQEVGRVRNMLDQYKHYQEFLALAEIIEAEVEQDKFPETPLGTALEIVDQLASSPDITQQPRFLEAVKVVIDLLVRTDRKADIDRMEVSLHEVFITDSKISLDLADHYGQLIISSPYAVEQLDHYFEPLSRYARACRELNYPEKALMWELFVAFKRSAYVRSSVTDSMVEMVQDLNEADMRNFARHIFLNSHPLHWMKQPDQEGRELAKLVQGLLENYPDFRQSIEAELGGPEMRDWVSGIAARKVERAALLQAEEAPHTAEADDPDNALRR